MTQTADFSTVALLERRSGMSDALFSAYWRDVHGTLATRIPGFWAYAQNHLEAHGPAASAAQAHEGLMQVDGLAEVLFLSEADRAGLIHSEVTGLIQRDETKVFSRTLLYSLAAGASRTLRGLGVPQTQSPAAAFVLVLRSPAGCPAAQVAAALESHLQAPLLASAGLTDLRAHLLTSGDPGLWSTVPGVDNTERGAQNSVVLQAAWADRAAAEAAITALRGRLGPAFTGLMSYRVKARYEMVVDGRPTMLGLRGLDALNTLEAAGAANQKEDAVLRILYGPAGLGVKPR
jgi:hypothetical protein